MNEFYESLKNAEPMSYNRNNFMVETNLENLKYLVNGVSFIGDFIKLSISMFYNDVIDTSLISAIDFMNIDIYNKEGTEIVKQYKYKVEYVTEVPADLSYSGTEKIYTTNCVFRIVG